MKRTCSYCGRIVDSHHICPSKPKKDSTKANKFRATKAWHNKSESIRERDHYLCQVCLRNKQLTYESISVHHIEPLCKRYDLRLEDSNLISLCPKHHDEAERGKIKRQYLKDLIAPRGEN